MRRERPITILVVDDSDHARSFVAEALRTAGFDVIEAATGTDGLRLARRGPDLIVLDVGLPDIDGRQVCRQIKDDPATASIPVVHISGVFQESLDRARALEDGADAYLAQPVTPEELVATVRTFLRVHQAEQESEERFRLLMDSAPILVSGFDAAGRVALFNRACEELTGLRRDDVLGQSRAVEFLPPAWHHWLKNREVVSDPTPAETCWQSATGTERVIESQAFFIPAGPGRRTLVQVGRDITERKQTDEALERRSAQAKSMVEVARGITSSLDLAAVLDLIVDRVRELLGISRASIAVIEPETSDAVIRFVASRGMKANFKELRPLHWRDGTTPTAIQERRPVWSADLLNDPAFTLTPSTRATVEAEGYRAVLSVPLLASDRALGALAVYRDAPGPFTDEEVDLLQIFAAQAAVAIRNAQLYAEAQRRQREAETVAVLTRAINQSLDLDAILQQVAETAQAFCGSDLARIALREPGSGSLVFRYWVGPGPSGWENARIEPGRGIGGRAFAEGCPVRTENYLSDPHISKDYTSLVRDDEVVAVLALPIRSEEHVEGVLYVANRSPRPFSDRDEKILLQLADYAGTAIRNARLYDELREAHERLERSQAQLIQTERLRALGEMAAGVAHDFNNLLAVILGRAELLQRRTTDPESKRGLEAVRTAAQDGADTVRRIQEFTRTRQSRSFGTVDILDVVREVVELTRPRWQDEAQSRGLRYDVTVQGEAVPVAGHPEELREVFTNLLSNALDAMPTGGSFRVRARTHDDTVVISAEDTGCGMSEDTRRRIFEPFFTTKGPRGNGLGLAVTWGIIQRHQGTIDVASAIGEGTRFTISLPAGKEAAVPSEEQFEPSPPAPDARVLVIDDEPEVRSILADLLEDGGYTVVQAADGAEGLRQLQAGSFDIVLSDVSMPGLSGWNVASVCRARFPGCHVGLVTGWGDQFDPDLIASSGIAFVLAKPFHAADVLRRVREALRAPARP
jgi:PAS domain S-box-containing protein